MQALSFYADAAYENQLSPQRFQPDDAADEADLSMDDLLALEIDSNDNANLQPGVTRRTTDLVRLYLQEIGRVHLLERDEEVSEAQKVQRHLRTRSLCLDKSLQEDQVIKTYISLIEAQERLTSALGHRPSLERWAATANIAVSELRPALAKGKRRWAEIAGLTVEELEQIQSDGVRAKEHMIKANLRLVVSVAKKYQNRGLELLDLVQEGTLGLVVNQIL